MRALTVLPDEPGSLAVTDVPDPEPGENDLFVDGLVVGVVRRPEWLGRLISRRVPLERFEDAFTGADDVKVVITLHG